MIFTEDLQDHVLSRHETVADAAKLIVVSGYLGPDPINRLGDLPIDADVVAGKITERKCSLCLNI